MGDAKQWPILVCISIFLVINYVCLLPLSIYCCNLFYKRRSNRFIKIRHPNHSLIFFSILIFILIVNPIQILQAYVLETNPKTNSDDQSMTIYEFELLFHECVETICLYIFTFVIICRFWFIWYDIKIRQIMVDWSWKRVIDPQKFQLSHSRLFKTNNLLKNHTLIIIFVHVLQITIFVFFFSIFQFGGADSKLDLFLTFSIIQTIYLAITIVILIYCIRHLNTSFISHDYYLIAKEVYHICLFCVVPHMICQISLIIIQQAFLTKFKLEEQHRQRHDLILEWKCLLSSLNISVTACIYIVVATYFVIERNLDKEDDRSQSAPARQLHLSPVSSRSPTANPNLSISDLAALSSSTNSSSNNLISLLKRTIVKYSNSPRSAKTMSTNNNNGTNNDGSPRSAKRRYQGFAAFLKTKKGFLAFVNHLMHELSVEHLLFVVEVDQYKAALWTYIYNRGWIPRDVEIPIAVPKSRRRMSTLLNIKVSVPKMFRTKSTQPMLHTPSSELNESPTTPLTQTNHSVIADNQREVISMHLTIDDDDCQLSPIDDNTNLPLDRYSMTLPGFVHLQNQYSSNVDYVDPTPTATPEHSLDDGARNSFLHGRETPRLVTTPIDENMEVDIEVGMMPNQNFLGHNLSHSSDNVNINTHTNTKFQFLRLDMTQITPQSSVDVFETGHQEDKHEEEDEQKTTIMDGDDCDSDSDDDNTLPVPNAPPPVFSHKESNSCKMHLGSDSMEFDIENIDIQLETSPSPKNINENQIQIQPQKNKNKSKSKNCNKNKNVDNNRVGDKKKKKHTTKKKKKTKSQQRFIKLDAIDTNSSSKNHNGEQNRSNNNNNHIPRLKSFSELLDSNQRPKKRGRGLLLRNRKSNNNSAGNNNSTNGPIQQMINEQSEHVRDDLLFDDILNVDFLPIHPIFKQQPISPVKIGKYICDKYVSNSSPICINIQFVTRRNILHYFENSLTLDCFRNEDNRHNHELMIEICKQLYHVFDESKKEILTLLRNDSFARFKSSAEYKEIRAMYDEQNRNLYQNKNITAAAAAAVATSSASNIAGTIINLSKPMEEEKEQL